MELSSIRKLTPKVHLPMVSQRKKLVKDSATVEYAPQDTFVTEDVSKTFSAQKVDVKSSAVYNIDKGYDENFLGDGCTVPLPRLTGPAKEDALVFDNKGNYVRNYTHFSVVMSKSRKFALYTAHNIDGAKLQARIKRGDFMFDEKVGEKNQIGHFLYANNPIDKGHLVRRLAVAWGSRKEAKRASDETFYYTNITPQHRLLNQVTWHKLENWLLERADEQDRKVSVFTGPVLRDDDKEYRGVKIPMDFWKIIVVKKKDGTIAAAGFIMSQKKLIDNLTKSVQRGKKDIDLEDVDTSEIAPYQVSIETIEKLTHLDFGNLKDIDAYSLYKSRHLYKTTHKGVLIEEEPLPAKNIIRKKEDIII